MVRPADSEWESVFGFSEDPTPGDTEILGTLARNYRSVANDAGDALPTLSGLESQEVGEGKSMEKLRDKLGDLANQVRKLHSSYEQAAKALDTYTDQLKEHQKKADNALDKGREAQERLLSATAVAAAAGATIGLLDAADHPPDDKEARASTRRALEEAHNDQSAAQGQADDAQADLDAARMLAEDAREVRESDAAVAARDLDDARDEAVPGYSIWEKIRDAFIQALGIISAVLGVLAMLIPGLQGLGLALTIGALVTGAAAFGMTIAKMADTGDWDIAELVLGVAGLALGGGALLKGAKAIGASLKGPGGSMKNFMSSGRSYARNLKCRVFKTDPVDVASGEMLLQETDLELPGVLPLVVRRTHLSTYDYGRFFGPSWASMLDERLEVMLDGAVLWAREDGSILRYPRLPDAGSDEVVWPEEGSRLPLSCGEAPATGEAAYRITDPQTGLVSSFEDVHAEDSDWLWLSRRQDRNSNEITVLRAEDGTPTALKHSGGYHVLLDTNDGRLDRISLATPEGPVEVMSYGHDKEGNLTHVTNSSGLPLVFDYDEESRITAWTDRNDSTYRYVYDDNSRVTETIGPDGYLSSRWHYDRIERQTRYTDACGATTVFQLNALHQVIAETDPLGNTTRSEWGRYDNLLSRTDALGNTTRFEYDENHNPTVIEMPDGSRSTATYNELNLPVTSTGHDGATWRQEFDERGNLTGVTAPDGITNHFTHHRNGAIASSTGPAGAVVTYEVDDAGLPRAVANSAEHRATIERDAFGRPTTVTDPVGVITRAVWTVEGRLSERTADDGRREQLTWDGEGNCLTHTDPAGGTSSFEYTHFDKLAARTGPDGVRYAFAYDAELRLTQVTSPQGLTWNYTYDRGGNLTAESDFDDREVAYELDALGRVVAHTTPLGEQITFRYNSVGELVAKDVAGEITSYTYDAGGALVRAASPVSTLVLERDLMGRLLAETVDGRTSRYTYDDLGRRTSRTTPTGAVTELSYDENGHRDALTTDGHRLAFTHDVLGREIARVWGSATSPVTATTAWDRAGRPAAQGLVAQGSALRQRAYTYRADDHLLAVADQVTGKRQDMELDPVGRPLAVTADGWTESYAYDQAGNQTEAAWPEKARQAEARGARTYVGTRIQAAGAVRYEHDAAGRMILRQKQRLSRKPDTWRYAYDVEDRLNLCTTPDGTHWRYTYDPLGRRTAKYRMGADGSVSEAVYFTWDGSRLAEQTDTTTGVTLTWEYDGHRPLTQLERRPRTQEEYDSRFFAVVTDLVGTPTELVDEQGDIAWRSRATLWGTTTRNRDATATTPLRFPGQYEDFETGLHYNYFRHYDPATGRYTTPDPLGLGPAPNPVAYVDHPYTSFDPLGLVKCDEKNPSWNGNVTWKTDSLGRPTEMNAKLDPNMIGGQTKVSSSMKPPGWQTNAGRHRSHLLGAQLGGSNKSSGNFVTLHGHTNTPVMSGYENQLRAAVEKGAKVDYKVKPEYKGNSLEPSSVTLNVSGGNFQFKDPAGNLTNSVTFPNKPKP